MSSSYRHATLSLIRKRSEHNECMVSDLEEIALHQEELEGLGSVLGRTCGKTLRILLLQNNVIAKIDPFDFKYFKVLEYLNLALNNIEVIDGIGHMEYLSKLDLTLNFIRLNNFERSIEHLKGLRCLRELFLMGNPSCYADEDVETGGWLNWKMYVIASLPQLITLDGKEISKSERIIALQRLPELSKELRELALENRGSEFSVSSDRKDYTQNTPQARAEISREMAQQKKEKDDKERANQPRIKGEKDFETEQTSAIQKARRREDDGDIKQCNEGKFKFRFDEETKVGCILLNVELPKYLSSSLVDVDVHPNYIRVVAKSKILRLLLPEEVCADQSFAQRSQTTGNLLITMRKVRNGKQNVITFPKESQTKRKTSFDEKGNTIKSRQIVWNENHICAVSVKKIDQNDKIISEPKQTLEDTPPPLI